MWRCSILFVHTQFLTDYFKRSFLKRQNSPNIPIQAIGLSLYEQLGTTSSNSGNGKVANGGASTTDIASADDDQVETPGTNVVRTQWLDLSSLEMANLIGKRVLIVDEVDDTRTTLEYAVKELQKDVETATEKLGRQGEKTVFSIFVLHVSVSLSRFVSVLPLLRLSCFGWVYYPFSWCLH